MANILIAAARGSALLWTVLVLALTGNMVSIMSGPSVVNYTVFTAVFSLLALLYLIPASFSAGLVFHTAVPLVIEGLATLFTFIAAIALPGYLGVQSCNNYGYLITNIVTAGSEQRCREAQASTAFLWFAWASFMVSLILTALNGRGTTHTTTARRGPAMSQV